MTTAKWINELRMSALKLTSYRLVALAAEVVPLGFAVALDLRVHSRSIENRIARTIHLHLRHGEWLG